MTLRAELEVTPEPPPGDAEAIAKALARTAAAAEESPWWRAGIEESLGAVDELE